jgi:glyoxylase I family protein
VRVSVEIRPPLSRLNVVHICVPQKELARLSQAPSSCYNPGMFKGIEHTAIASPDPKRLAQWYVDHLEFVINYEYDGNYFVKSANGGTLEIIPSEGERAEQKMKTPGIRHLAILVDDFDAAHAHLQKSGVQFLTQPANIKGNRLVFFPDADGNLVHLIYREKPLP